MKVLHVIPSITLKHGGASYVVRQLSEGLAREGVDVTVATTDSGMQDPLSVATGCYSMERGVRYIYFHHQTPTGWTFSWPLTRWLYRNAGDFHLVHVHGVFSYPTWPACKAASMAGVPYTVCPHGMLDPYSMSVKSWKKRPYYRWIEHSNLMNAAALHVASGSEGRNLARLGFGDKIAVIPHGVKLPKISRGQQDGKARPLQILFMSRLHPKKALPDLLDAAAKLHRQGFTFNLTVAGNGDARYENKLRTYSNSLEISRCVRFTGYVEGEVKEQLFQQADLFVLPSYHENFGVVVVEAMNYGLPLVVSDQVALAEEIAEAGAGVVIPVNDSDALAGAIFDLADGAKLRAAGKNGARLAKQRYDVREQVRAVLRLYEHQIVG